MFFFFNDTATTEIYTLSLHDALPISLAVRDEQVTEKGSRYIDFLIPGLLGMNLMGTGIWSLAFSITSARNRRVLKRLRSEEHTSELQSRQYLVCRLLLEKKKKNHML